MARFVEIKKRISENKVETFMPMTSSNVTMYTDGRTVSEVLSTIISDLTTIKNMLGIAGNVYVLDEKGNKIPDEENSDDYLISLNETPDSSMSLYVQDNSGTILDDGADSNLIAINTITNVNES